MFPYWRKIAFTIGIWNILTSRQLNLKTKLLSFLQLSISRQNIYSQLHTLQVIYIEVPIRKATLSKFYCLFIYLPVFFSLHNSSHSDTLSVSTWLKSLSYPAAIKAQR